MTAAGWRTARLAAPVLDRIRIVTVEGYVEEMDERRQGARFVLRVFATDGLDVDKTPYRVRLTTRRAPGFDAGAYVSMKARLLPPSRAAEPGGYDFARDAWFARIGAVGSVLGTHRGGRGAGAARPLARRQHGDRPRPQRAGAARRCDRRRRCRRHRRRHGHRQARSFVGGRQGALSARRGFFTSSPSPACR